MNIALRRWILLGVFAALSFSPLSALAQSDVSVVQVEITVRDTASGAVKVYRNPQGRAFVAIQDTSAFATCP